jgi:toxin ParE1/3/4
MSNQPSSYSVSTEARNDIDEILNWTHQVFGEQSVDRYGELITQSFLDIAEDIYRAGSHARPEFGDTLRAYHLKFSRDRVSKAMRVANPRHTVYFRLREDGIVEIARVLHDEMDHQLHLTD